MYTGTPLIFSIVPPSNCQGRTVPGFNATAKLVPRISNMAKDVNLLEGGQDRPLLVSFLDPG